MKDVKVISFVSKTMAFLIYFILYSFFPQLSCWFSISQECVLKGKVIESRNTASHVCIYGYVCMSGTLLTGEKKIRDTMASLLLSERAPPDWGLNPELDTMVDRRGTSAENA
jgi:hypothetical protein